MPTPLPPLTSLRAFEAAARHLSLKKAAHELNVTPAAISHQIQQIEDFLGVRLFRRLHRGIEITEAGQIFIPKLQEGFDCLRQAMHRVRDHHGADVLTVVAAPSFTSRWLFPRLHHFVTKHPHIDVRVSTRMRQFLPLPRGHMGDMQSVLEWVDEVDVAVVFGNGDYPGVRVDKLLSLSITPFCSPALLAEGVSLRNPEDVRHHQLLHDDRGLLYEGRSYWDMWLEQAGVSGVDTHQGARFTHSVLALEAATAKLGIVVSTPVLASTDLATGRLVAPFALEVPLASSYYVVRNETASKRAVVKIFTDWLLEQAGASSSNA